MTAPHPDDPLHDDWQAQEDIDAGAFAERAEHGWDEPLNEEDTSQPWEIRDDSGADWALRKIGKAEAEVARVEAIAKAEVDRINAIARAKAVEIGEWKAAATKPRQDDISFFKAHLIDYRRRLEDADPSLPKTYKLPAGDLTRRKGATRIEVTDEAAFIAWAQENDPSLLSLKPLVSRLKDGYRSAVPDADESSERAVHIMATGGEIVPGVQQVHCVEIYSVKAR